MFDDERAGFERHLRYFKNIGEVIGIDDAVEMITKNAPVDGRYICITFDDGFKNWIENALPILVEQDVTAAFFLATGYIGSDPSRDRDRLIGFYEDGSRLMAFLDWDDCRTLVAAGMSVGSHTVNHVHLRELSDDDAMRELIESKTIIERETGVDCKHFCCPFGRRGIDFDARHQDMVSKAGYVSFLTGHRGSNRPGHSPYGIRRDHMLANWGNYQLRYFLGTSG